MQSNYTEYTADYSSQPPDVGGCLLRTLALLAFSVLLIVFTLGMLVSQLFV
jgi:hypothetical protein